MRAFLRLPNIHRNARKSIYTRTHARKCAVSMYIHVQIRGLREVLHEEAEIYRSVGRQDPRQSHIEGYCDSVCPTF